MQDRNTSGVNGGAANTAADSTTEGFKEKEAELHEREALITKREDALLEHEKALDASITAREDAMFERERLMSLREENVTKQELAVAEKISGMEACESTLPSKPQASNINEQQSTTDDKINAGKRSSDKDLREFSKRMGVPQLTDDDEESDDDEDHSGEVVEQMNDQGEGEFVYEERSLSME